MGVNSDGEGPVDCGKKRKRTDKNQHEHNEDKYKLYKKPQYKRLFSENHSSDCVVYVESTEQEKVGNKNPITLNNLFNENVKGIIGVHKVNAYKIGITFRKPAPANSFLKMEDFLSKNKPKAFIPAYMTEKTGIIRYVPEDMSNEEIYKNIACDVEVISIKRFMRKVDGKLTPLDTVAVSYASNTLPQYAFIKIFRYPIHTYIPPLLQCYRCLEFNHSAKACRGEQMCSSCAGQYSYKECVVDSVICKNCSGNHLPISRDCPVKIPKIEGKKVSTYLNQSYASVTSVPFMSNEKEFPTLKKPVRNNTSSQPNKTDTKVQFNNEQIVNNEIIMNALVKTLISLGYSNDGIPLTNKKIKEMLFSNLI